MRHDGKAMSSLYETVAFNYPLFDAIDDGWLVPISRTVVEIDGLDLTSISKSNRDFTDKSLAPILMEPDVLKQTVHAIAEADKGRKNIVFSRGVAHAVAMCEIMNKIDPGSSVYVYGEMPNRPEIIKKFKTGRAKRIFNSHVLSHGYDDPDIEVVTMTAPSKSMSSIMQKMGRGTRVLPGVIDGIDDPSDRRQAIADSDKPELEVIDMIGNCGVHKVVDEFDILGGDYCDSVVSEARSRSKNKKVDVAQALREAKEAIDASIEKAFTQY